MLVVENVVEFTAWALYTIWCDALRRLGYALAEYIIDAADGGVPQHRKRLFVIGTRSRAALELPKPEADHRPAADIIDFSAGKWSPVKKPGRAPKTIARIEAGRAQHGDRFVTAYYGSTKGGRSIDRPLGTVTTRNRWAVIDGEQMRMLSVEETKAAMGFRADYMLPANDAEAIHLLGNAVVPKVAEWLLTEIRRAA